MKTKLHTLTIISGISVALLSSCSSLKTEPESQRAATPPRGSTDVEKSWNAPTKQETDAMLGPLSQQRR